MHDKRVLLSLLIGLTSACGQGEGAEEPPAAVDVKTADVKTADVKPADAKPADADAKPADAGPFDLANECARLGTMAEAEGLIPPHLVPRNVDTCNRDIAALEAASPAEYAKQTRCLTDAKDYVAAQSCSEQATMALQRLGK